MTEGNLVSTKEAAEAAGYAPDYVGYLARTGKIFSKRIGRDWFTTVEAVRAHKEGGPRVEPVPIRIEKPEVILTATADRGELERLRKEVKVLRRLLKVDSSHEELQRFQPGWRQPTQGEPFLPHQPFVAPKPRQYHLRRAGVVLFGLVLLAIIGLQPSLARSLARFATDVGESFKPRTIEALREANVFNILFGSLSGLWDELKTQLFLR